jgi:hypothetical protein
MTTGVLLCMTALAALQVGCPILEEFLAGFSLGVPGPESPSPSPSADGSTPPPSGESPTPTPTTTPEPTATPEPSPTPDPNAVCAINELTDTDRDGDGIDDVDENAGWTVFVDESGQGDTVPRDVSSDPIKADTDGDGLCDAEERTIRTDPTTDDTDTDGLSDLDEIRVWGSSPNSVDSDGDATDLGAKPLNGILFDGNEVASLGTSPTLADSDGDKISDFVEVIERGNEFHPLIANLPQLELSLEGATDLRVNISFDDSSQESETHEVGLTSEQSQTFSASTTATVKVWAEASAKVTGETGASIDSNKVGAEVGFTAGVSAELSGTLSASSTESSQQSYQNAVQTSRQEGRSLESGTLGVGINVRNVGDVSFDLSNLAITAIRRDLDDLSNFSTVATLAMPLTSSVTLGPGDSSGLLRAETDIPANVAMELMANAQTLAFETGNFDLLDDEGRNLAFFREVTNSQTGLVTIEYGNGNVVRKRIATNVKREDGQIVGVSLGEVLSDILEIPFETAENDVGVRILSSLTDLDLGERVFNVEDEPIFWSVLVTNGIELTDQTHFDDIVLRAGEGVFMLYLTDRDADGLFARDEFTYGSNDTLPDTDGDGITDFDEVMVGWSVPEIGVTPYPQFVYPDPTRTDTDGDSLSDAEEMALGTDPRNADTDGEGILDSQDEDPLDPFVPVNQPPVIDSLEVTPNGLMATLDAAVSEPDSPGAIVEVLVQWGDATEETVTENFGNIHLTHDYPESGLYTITLTATDDRNGITSDTRDVDVTSFPFEGLIAEYLMSADEVYSHSGVFYAPDSRPDAPVRQEGDPPGATDGKIYRWQDTLWTGQGDGGVWTATADRFEQLGDAFYFGDANVVDEFYGQIRVPNLGFEESFSLAVWVREDGNGWLVGQENWVHLSLITNAAGVEFVVPGVGGVTLTDNTPLVADAWHFFVAVVIFDESAQSSIVRLYRDGQLVDSASGVGSSLGLLNPDPSAPLMIGDGSGREDQEFNQVRGYLDDVRVWDRALSASEITLLCELGGFACGGG